MENTAQKQRKRGKMHDKWLGSYTVHKDLGKGVYQLRNLTGTVLKKSHQCNEA